ncbi:type I-U CRISPR-associated helicase/endonuclease Cas3 [Blastochloris viridis]|uniref:Helicase Cas3 n=1 Tax=Blastochloris viridis TaxID=1079 RepID=A0A0H5BHT7_BLAVI|nr:type I-U CRISPR-associated helicase/endonuclease Cas3 [Blastochloris viridis]ALK09404.1 CRISPR-associated endonuclease/helicase Cas3 [Blastochloris viridis]BAS00715.1 CRISPR-associated helicase Cas3 [Blastochloris viridis]CUU42067.1 helicase Cas3 [Blastochloris viridis]
MTEALKPSEFAAFFREVHGQKIPGFSPFPWQTRLLEKVAADGWWPALLDLPTGSGKTAAIDIAVFHLALEAEHGAARRAPVRIAFVVDRRLIVDDVHAHAKKIAEALAAPQSPVVARVAARLKALAGNGPPLAVARLRGGVPREDDWASTPSQPTVLCSTVDQVGSRLLFRGYGVSDRMKPVHAGLIGSDCLILLDEAHLAEPFRQTLGYVTHYRGDGWFDPAWGVPAPFGVVQLSATAGENSPDPFRLGDDDRAHEVLKRRIEAPKPAALIGPAKAKAAGDDEEADETADTDDAENMRRVAALAKAVQDALKTLTERGVSAPAIGAVVNRVVRARSLFERLKTDLDADGVKLVLLIGPARPVDREQTANDALKPIRTGEARPLEKPLVVVATQCIEAGVDVDFDGLITEAAPIDALRQRFGRLNRAGRAIEPAEANIPIAAIVATKRDLSPRADDPVYGPAIRAAWTHLSEHAAAPTRKGGPPIIDFGIAAFEAVAASAPPAALSPRPDAPVLMPAHLDLLSWTAPVPRTGPEIGLYLHGAGRESATVTVAWRADIDPDLPDETRRLLALVPPRAAETIELPVSAVRRWLDAVARQARPRVDRDLADIAARAEEDEPERAARAPVAFRWAGDDDRSAWIAPRAIRPGDTIVVPAKHGGVDEFGWNPSAPGPATDVAAKAIEPFAGKRFAVRVAPGLLRIEIEPQDGETEAAAEARQRKEDGAREDAVADTLAETLGQPWKVVRDALAALDLPDDIKAALNRLDEGRQRKARPKVEVYTDLYGVDDEDRPRGVVLVAPSGLKDVKPETGAEDGQPAATEDDVAGSMPGFTQGLDTHCGQVSEFAERFARAAGLPDARVTDVTLAALLHDLGKADPRFQALLAFDDPLGADPAHPLAKSARPAPRGTVARVDLPARWRHEALSVRLAPLHPRFAEAEDPDLVQWLIGTHHGHGRPLFPHADSLDAEARTLPLAGNTITLPAGPGPQSLAFEHDGVDWAGLFERLKARYGVWELARFEAVLRLADHRASDFAARAAEGDAT